MKEIVAHILDIAVVVVALVAIITIITVMTRVGETEADSGFVTNKVNNTVESVFDKTDKVIEDGYANQDKENGKTEGTPVTP